MAVSNLLLGLFLLVFIAIARSQCPSRNQDEVLRSLSKSIQITAWNESIEWSRWPGIALDAQGRVSNISIARRNLTGTLPPVWDELPSLVALDVSQNRLFGVNATTCKNTVLQSLNLSSNSLKDMVNLSNLERLEILDLNGNGLTAAPRFKTPALRALNLSFNNLTDIVSIGEAIGENLGLEFLEAAHNQFLASIPEFLGRMIKLRRLDISSNNLTGEIPEFLGNFTELRYLGLSENELQGGIPRSLRNLRNLTVLSAGRNNLSGELELEVGDFPMMEFLSLPNNDFSGRLPTALGSLPNLRLLVLTSNRISGGIPPELGNCKQLQEIWLNNNRLTEVLPVELSKLSDLRQLVLSQNNITGTIPAELARCSHLRVLWMEQNNFTGRLPESLGGLSELIILSLANNHLVGHFPESYANLSSLIGLDVGGNKFDGEIPVWLSKLSKLQFLFLSNNKFEGSIPEWLPDLSDVRALDFSSNYLTGVIPASIGRLFDGVELYNISSQTPLVHSRSLVYTGFATPITIDFSSNSLNGSIPEEIGNISKLQVLDLSHNQLTGSIPESLGNDRNLFRVVLSSNALTGRIPSSVANLSFMNTFNVSNNNLEGEIPQHSQLPTFDPSFFAGNQLCGLPLEKCSSGIGSPGTNYTDMVRQGDRIPRVALFITIGAAIIICAFLITYFTLVRRRHKLHSNTERENPSFSLAFCEKLPEQICPQKLAAATDNYSHDHIVGDGGFGVVYRAVLENGQVVAVKKLSSTGLQGEREFRAELQTLGEIKHKNLVPLLGYCSDHNDRLLIYKYLKNGSVDTWLYCREPCMKPLDWPIRLRIARGAAQGIAYLHQGGEHRHSIIHRDIKVSNILLDDDFEAHVADFGLARQVNVGDTHVSTDVAGTIGYIPPEYNHKCIATPKGDVYSFGVVCLEILTAKRPTDQFFRKTTLVSWIQGMRSAEERKLALDGCLLEQSQGAGAAEFDQMLEMMRVACLCCRDAPSKRPSMQEVASLLERLEKRITLGATGVSSLGSSPCRERSSSHSSSNSSSSNSSGKNTSHVVELSATV